MKEIDRIKANLSELALTLKACGESQKAWEKKQINWQKGIAPFDDFIYYIALATTWQTFSRRLEGKARRKFVGEIYHAFKKVINGASFTSLEEVLRHYRASRFMVGVNLLRFWAEIIKEMRKQGTSLSDALLIQDIAQSHSSRTQHWLTYAPLEAAIVVGEIFPPSREIIPPLGQTVMHGFSLLGLDFRYPPIKRELEIIHHFLLHLASLANTNHLVIEMGIWRLGYQNTQV